MIQSERSLRSFSAAVEAIYDCALDAAHWNEALRLIGALTDSPCAAMGTTDYARGRETNGQRRNINPSMHRLLQLPKAGGARRVEGLSFAWRWPRPRNAGSSHVSRVRAASRLLWLAIGE